MNETLQHDPADHGCDCPCHDCLLEAQALEEREFDEKCALGYL